MRSSYQSQVTPYVFLIQRGANSKYNRNYKSDSGLIYTLVTDNHQLSSEAPFNFNKIIAERGCAGSKVSGDSCLMTLENPHGPTGAPDQSQGFAPYAPSWYRIFMSDTVKV